MLTQSATQATERIDAVPMCALPPSSEGGACAPPNITTLGEMARETVHDFRNVLCVLTSGLRLVERSAGDPARLELAFSAMQDGLARGLEATKRLVEFTRQQEAAAERDAEEALEQWADEGGAVAPPPPGHPRS